MKIFDSKVVSKWIANPGGIIRARKPKPFPGKAPTRIMLNWFVNGKSMSYIGKPSRIVYQKFIHSIAAPLKGDFGKSFFVSVEFDKGGIITYTKGQADLIPVMKTNEAMWMSYHPDLRVDSFPSWLRYDYRVVNGTYKIV